MAKHDSRCNSPDCDNYKVDGEYCIRHKVLNNKPEENSYKFRYSHHKLYFSTNWRKLRQKKLSQNPVCEKCGNVGQEIDHIIDHKGNTKLFYDIKNLQTLCKSCHSRKTITATNIKRYKEAYEMIEIIVGNCSDFDNTCKQMQNCAYPEYVLQIIVKSGKTKYYAKTYLEAKLIEQAYIETNKIKPIFEIIQEVEHGNKK